MTAGISALVAPRCRDEQRRADLLVHPSLNGIDFVEYERRPGPPPPPNPPPDWDPYLHVLVVRMLKPLPDPPHSDPDGAYDLTNHPEHVHVLGGARVVNIAVRAVRLVGDHLEIEVSAAGDFSDYVLLLGWTRAPDGRWLPPLNLDPQFSVTLVNFKAGCPVDFDCRPGEVCPPEIRREPAIDYLAKDYASFRRLLLDLVPLLNPDWYERSPADLGIALVELLAYEGDQLSYFQDAVANEAYLDTARQRVSAKRHARLVDYAMHDGRNAWAFVHVRADSTGTIPLGTRVLSRVTAPLRNQLARPGPVIPQAHIPDADAFETDPALEGVRVFETTFDLATRPENNEIYLHAWGNRECCLPAGVTTAHVYVLGPPVGGLQQAARPALNQGDFLLIEEVKGPTTGAPADADRTHRQVVEIVSVPLDTEDPAYGDRLLDGTPLVRGPGDPALPLREITWRFVDGLQFPICLSTAPPGAPPLLNISVARGNIVAADHGLTVVGDLPTLVTHAPDRPVRLRLPRGPLTMQCQPDAVTYDPSLALVLLTPRRALGCAPGSATAAVNLRVDFTVESASWQPVPHLLDSPPFARHFVVDVDGEGRAELRLGDGDYGRSGATAIGFAVTYRVGNGRAGNVGAESLAHVIRPPAPPAWPDILALRNPLPARDGSDAETIEQVRQYAPAAFRAEQFRAVTEEDWARAACKMPGVAGAVAAFRWTGSWYTVYVGIDASDPEQVITDPGGRTRLTPGFAGDVRRWLTRYKLAGYDLEIRAAEYVPLAIDLDVCVSPDHFRGDVAAAVRQALSNRVNADGSIGFFHPGRWSFGQPVYVSQLYAAVERVPGVDSVVVTRFEQFGRDANGELAAGVIELGPWEIARLDNDPNFMERGLLRIHAMDGK